METIKKWAKSLGIKVIKTMSQTATAYIGTSAFIGEINWLALFSTVLLSGLMTILMNLSQLETEEE